MSEIALRDYQSNIIGRVRDAYRTGARAVLLAAPTGSGKTVIFSHVAAGAAAKDGRVLILAHRQELIRQTSNMLAAFGLQHGLIAPGQPTTTHVVQVASVQTLVRRLARLDWRPTLIVVDEAHHATRTTGHGRVLEHFAGAHILGVTATPARLDGKGLGVVAGGFFERLVLGPTVAELIADGFLSRPVVFAPPGVPDLSGLRMRGGDFARDALAAVVDVPKIIGNAVDHYRRHAGGVPAIAFCASVRHAEHVAEAFRAEGFNAASIDGGMADKERAERISDLGAGSLHVLTSCDLVSEGTDIPIVGAAILLRPTQSLALYLQQVGRVLRPYPGKERAVILDHVGNCYRHGLPDDDREWSLKGRRRRASDAAPQDATKHCNACHTVHRPAPACPSCGFVYPVQLRVVAEVAGELGEVDPAAVRAARDAEQRRARTLDELRQLGAARGYRPGWAERVHAARQGRGFPPRAAGREGVRW
jgi:superfamily II DNA or RNA helicase